MLYMGIYFKTHKPSVENEHQHLQKQHFYLSVDYLKASYAAFVCCAKQFCTCTQSREANALALLKWQLALHFRRMYKVAVADKIGAHFIVDANALCNIDEGKTLFIAIDNLFDEVYEASRRPAGLRPGKPFTARVGFKLKF